MRQVDLAAARLHGRAGLAEPVEDPVGIENQRRGHQREARCDPRRQDFPFPREQQRGTEGEDKLWFDQRQAEGKPRQVRSGPQGERGAETKGDNAVELSVQQHQCGWHSGEAREDRGRRSRSRREVEPRGQAGKTEEHPEPAADLRSESVERHCEKGDPRRREERKDAPDAKSHEDAAAGHVELHTLLGVEVI